MISNIKTYFLICFWLAWIYTIHPDSVFCESTFLTKISFFFFSTTWCTFKCFQRISFTMKTYQLSPVLRRYFLLELCSRNKSKWGFTIKTFFSHISALLLLLAYFLSRLIFEMGLHLLPVTGVVKRSQVHLN